MNRWNKTDLEDYVSRAEYAFYLHKSLYSWSNLILGVDITVRAQKKRFSAVGGNTFRGFHRIDKSKPGASSVYRDYFTQNKTRLLSLLRNVRSSEELDDLSNQISEDIRPLLNNIRIDQLDAYNKLRKPIDLYIENLVSMSKDFEFDRERLTPFLFLPLDSQMMISEWVFSEAELRSYSLSRRSTYGDIKDKYTYVALQKLTSTKAMRVEAKLERPFHRVYFDLLWFDRYKFGKGNLFELIQ